ncbi:hypothetical protein [Corynebacterium sp. p3-SID1194]|uniref:hypothetical protein n=1 Tax=Corynebacterium sp. p3-SID1194 TaxID=2916105 RepID=UPI0021A51B4F|nr:hypothetical protein [Corynebacterium sp. p3-SID1194]MCT1450024.1 hypothetical protein [Corynebacterium sp. p3-SID1194]
MHSFSRRIITAALLATTALAVTSCSDTQDDSASPALTTVESSAAETSTQSSASEQPSSTAKDTAPSSAKKDDADEKDNNKEDEQAKEEKPDKDGDKVDMASAPSGTHCGEITDNQGDPLLVIAIADGADCTTGVEMVKTYLSPNPPGTMHPGSAAIWESPDGWACSARVIPPGANDEPANRKIGCGPNTSDRTVILLSPDEAPTYGL